MGYNNCEEAAPMVRHIVSWNFKPELSEEERRAAAETLVARMTALRDLVPCVERLEVFSAPHRSEQLATCAWYTEIDKEENLVVYRDHPEHQKVVKLIHQWCCDRRCTDMPM